MKATHTNIQTIVIFPIFCTFSIFLFDFGVFVVSPILMAIYGFFYFKRLNLTKFSINYWTTEGFMKKKNSTITFILNSKY